MSNPMTLPALKRMYSDLKANIAAESYEERGKYRRVVISGLMADLLLSKDNHYVIKCDTAVVNNAVRQNIKEVKPRFLGGVWLIMQDNWARWTPSDITLTDEDVSDLKALALNGVRHQRWEPDWRLYGAGMIDVDIQTPVDVYFHVTISQRGRAALEAELGKSVDELRAFEQEEKQRRADEAAQRYIRYRQFTDRDGIHHVNFTVPELPDFGARYSTETKRLEFWGTIRRDTIGLHLHGTSFGKFIIGVDMLISYAVRGDRCYYDINQQKVVMED